MFPTPLVKANRKPAYARSRDKSADYFSPKSDFAVRSHSQVFFIGSQSWNAVHSRRHINRRHVEGLIGTDDDVVGTAPVDQTFAGLWVVRQAIEVETLEQFPRWHDVVDLGLLAHLVTMAETADLVRNEPAAMLHAIKTDSGIGLTELRVGGGAARDDALMQFKTDLLDLRVIRPRIQ